MVAVNVYDDVYKQAQTPFVLECVPKNLENAEYFRLKFDEITVFISKERLLELHAVIDKEFEIEQRLRQVFIDAGRPIDIEVNEITTLERRVEQRAHDFPRVEGS